jgi:hypothetical protein
MDWWENLPETMDLTSLNIGTFPVDSPFKPCWYLPEMVNVYIANWKDPPFSSWENPLFLWSFSLALCMFTRPGIVNLWSGPVTGTLPSSHSQRLGMPRQEPPGFFQRSVCKV